MKYSSLLVVVVTLCMLTFSHEARSDVHFEPEGGYISLKDFEDNTALAASIVFLVENDFGLGVLMENIETETSAAFPTSSEKMQFTLTSVIVFMRFYWPLIPGDAKAKDYKALDIGGGVIIADPKDDLPPRIEMPGGNLAGSLRFKYGWLLTRNLFLTVSVRYLVGFITVLEEIHPPFGYLWFPQNPQKHRDLSPNGFAGFAGLHIRF